jgi:signal transduction histidine kinase
MRGLFWRLFAVFWLAFIAIDIGHSFAQRYIEQLPIARSADSLFELAIVSLAAHAAALPIALALSAFLSWYLLRPIRVMRSAFSAISAGRLDTRVRHLLRSQRDDIVDLGRDFDGMAHRLEGLVAVRQSVLRDVSHELRSPLARLQTAIGLAQQNPEKMIETLERIENESQRLQSMLENMLALAQIEAGAALPPREPVDPIELLAGIARDAQFEAQARGCDVAFEASGLCMLPAQAEWLHRAFENVVRNAVKYTEVDSCVQIAADCDSTRLHVTIMDRGPGVAEAELAHIFEPFYRASQPAAQVPGFGVGLAIARRAIEFHGGSIAATNRSDGGLRVDIELPLQPLLS